METRTDRVLTIAIVGCGNVATHLAKALDRVPWITICAISNRSLQGACRLADELSGAPRCIALEELADLSPDVVVVSVADNAIAPIAAKIGHISGDPLVLHTSGTIPKEVLAPMSARKGIIYPLQTFSRDACVDISSVPFFNEADSDADLSLADSIASAISRSVHHADESHRRILHIAGVFSCNFPNVLLECTQRILAEAGYGLEVVEPLVRATVDKAFTIGPHAAQTGPARRGDTQVIERQQAALPPDLAGIYKILTQTILKSHHNEQNQL